MSASPDTAPSSSDHAVQRIATVTDALRTYEHGVFGDGPSAVPGEPAYVQTLMSSLICDLEHFASANGVDFMAAAVAGHETYADEIAAARRYAVGDAVQLRHSPHRRGIISGTDDAHADHPSYLVKVPGLPYVHHEHAVALEPIGPFPPVKGMFRVAVTVDQAEAELIDAWAHLHLGSAAPAWTQTYDRALKALTAWSGCTSHELLTNLRPQIDKRIQQLRAATPQPEHPARLASHDRTATSAAPMTSTPRTPRRDNT
ncbi:hypothetical protein [Actinomadura harenae]|uniref:Uncharacterized protein n=1 Tax=Actinomadura harenae TaxID=2483351 RepID=A0A3M2M4E7_9ACTN|nr:hypothetical protein [Actinomadura harenae]RMI43920.1 hypothetical protein EBO15_14550 [Actinomadura harenae]